MQERKLTCRRGIYHSGEEAFMQRRNLSCFKASCHTEEEAGKQERKLDAGSTNIMLESKLSCLRRV